MKKAEISRTVRCGMPLRRMFRIRNGWAIQEYSRSRIWQDFALRDGREGGCKRRGKWGEIILVWRVNPWTCINYPSAENGAYAPTYTRHMWGFELSTEYRI